MSRDSDIKLMGWAETAAIIALVAQCVRSYITQLPVDYIMIAISVVPLVVIHRTLIYMVRRRRADERLRAGDGGQTFGDYAEEQDRLKQINALVDSERAPGDDKNKRESEDDTERK